MLSTSCGSRICLLFHVKVTLKVVKHHQVDLDGLTRRWAHCRHLLSIIRWQWRSSNLGARSDDLLTYDVLPVGYPHTAATAAWGLLCLLLEVRFNHGWHIHRLTDTAVESRQAHTACIKSDFRRSLGSFKLHQLVLPRCHLVNDTVKRILQVIIDRLV